MKSFYKIINFNLILNFLIFCSLTIFLITKAHAGVLLQGFYWDAHSPSNNTWWDQLSEQSEIDVITEISIK